MTGNETKGAASGAASGAAAGAVAGSVVPGIGTAIGAVAGGFIGGIGGFMSGGAADDAEKLAEMQARFKEMETTENLKRMRAQAQYTLGATKATIYGNNLVNSGSSNRYMDELNAQATRDRAWYAWSSAKEQEMIRAGGSTVSSGIMNSLYANSVQQIASAGLAAYDPAGGYAGGYGGSAGSYNNGSFAPSLVDKVAPPRIG